MNGHIRFAGAGCDTHIHFYDHRYASAPTAKLHPPDASIDAYRAFAEEAGIKRAVVVQPTTYGLDNSCQLAAMSALEASGTPNRGVMVVDDSVSDSELDRLTALGVRGARFHMLPGGAVTWAMLPTVAARVHELGWHIQLQLDGNELCDRLDLLRALPGTLVIDHVGRFMPPVSDDHPRFKALLTLVAEGRTWVKLSAPYESSVTGPPTYHDVAGLARALVGHAPERLLWASNWPHPGQAAPPAPADLVRLAADWAEDPATMQRVLVDNPTALYGF